jgi:error-prone DNA polymerase
VIFLTLEDETGVANVIVWPKVFERFRQVVLGGRLIRVDGRLQNEQGVIHVVADRLDDETARLARLAETGPALDATMPGDEIAHPVTEIRGKITPTAPLSRLVREAPELAEDVAALAARARRVLPKGRNFH